MYWSIEKNFPSYTKTNYNFINIHTMNNQELMIRIKRANKQWFSTGNKDFFGDIKYYAVQTDYDAYFIQHTKKWGDKEVFIVKKMTKMLKFPTEPLAELNTLDEAYSYIGDLAK